MDQNRIAEIREKITSRIPRGWGKWISMDSGWYELINDLDDKIAYLAPNYEIHQVKEKFGTLRFYVGGAGTEIDTKAADIINDLISYAEQLSENICEICGAARYGTIRTRYDNSVKVRCRNYWYKTLCNDCAIIAGYPVDEEEKDD